MVGLAACSLQAPEPSDAYLEEGMRSQVLESVQALNYPYESDPSYSLRMANLQTRLINECVMRQGVVPPQVPEVDLGAAEIVPSEARLWLLPGADYGIATALSDPRVLAELAASSAEERDIQSTSPPDPDAYELAVYGPDESRIEFLLDGGGKVTVPVAGCFGEATRTMYGVSDAADYERAYYEIPNLRDVLPGVKADATVQAAAKKWSSCMAEAGYRVSIPTDLYETMSGWVSQTMAGELAPDTLRDLERTLAGSDVECRTSSGLGTRLSAVFLEISSEEIEGKEGVVQEYRSMIEHAQSLIATS